MEKIIKYIEEIENGSFVGWSEDAENGFITACVSIKEKIHKTKNEKRAKAFEYIFNYIEDFGDIKYKDMGKHRPMSYNCINLGTVFRIIKYLSGELKCLESESETKE